MIPVTEALAHLFALAPVMPIETVPLAQANGRVLATPVAATLTQPPFASSAMDGYAVIGSEVAIGATFRIIGESAAGRGFAGRVSPGQAVRIFTGAPVPEGADHVVIQEDTTRAEDRIILTEHLDSARNIRPAGADFIKGQTVSGPRRLRPADIALLASMNIAEVPVRVRPVVAIIATGDELVQPGEMPGPDQIIASNSLGLAALLADLGAEPRLLPIARDTADSLTQAFALAEGADLILTIGGASVGDYDLVGGVTEGLGMERAFYKIAMRPGKPLMAGRLGTSMLIGLPGNPVSAMVCGTVFAAPVIRAMLGLGAHPAPRRSLNLGAPLGPNGPREHYMRAIAADGTVRAFDRQDSALLSILAEANCLIVRPVNDGARLSGDRVEIIDL